MTVGQWPRQSGYDPAPFFEKRTRTDRVCHDSPMNPLRRILSRFRREPSMVGTPPSAWQVSANSSLHAVDFSLRYAEPMNFHVENRMMELGIPTGQIGTGDADYGILHAAFHPQDKIGGSNGAGARLTVDSGVFNPELMAGKSAERVWRKARLRDRLDAVIAHEYEEARGGGHAAALVKGPDTELPIREHARKLLRSMRGEPWTR